MPLSPHSIAERRETITFPFAGDTCTITYLAGRLAGVTASEWQAWMTEASALDDDAGRRYLAGLVCRFVVAWDVVDGTEANAPWPLDVEHLAQLDPVFLATLLREAARATAEGNASAARSDGASAATSPTTATPAGSQPSAAGASPKTSR